MTFVSIPRLVAVQCPFWAIESLFCCANFLVGPVERSDLGFFQAELSQGTQVVNVIVICVMHRHSIATDVVDLLQETLRALRLIRRVLNDDVLSNSFVFKKPLHLRISNDLRAFLIIARSQMFSAGSLYAMDTAESTMMVVGKRYIHLNLILLY